MPVNTCSTSTATTTPASEGTAKSRHLWVWGSGPSRARCVQSMASRKQTTASPEKMPMNTDRRRKKPSSLNTPSTAENSRCAGRRPTAEAADEVFEELVVETKSLIERRPRVSGKSERTPGPDLGAAHKRKQFAAQSGKPHP